MQIGFLGRCNALTNRAAERDGTLHVVRVKFRTFIARYNSHTISFRPVLVMPRACAFIIAKPPRV